ncbi:TPA: autotransporter outer membrane beta-barrel domain-containing protein, partial [Escherichia coli]|nr:autotransporter outer membrane beta-barrel domain-containing protein [Escherichia coli]
MNKIYALKYSYITGGLIAVSELTRKITFSTGRKCLVTAIALSLSSPVLSSTVSAEIPYQTFRDFAENKGAFTPGTENITIRNNKGEAVGTLNAPMPDFSNTSTRAWLTLISPAYGVTVKHGDLGSQTASSFGYQKHSYDIIKNNVNPDIDFTLSRLEKLVTETIPVDINNTGSFSDTARYTAFYRAGSGSQYTKDRTGKQTAISGGFMTGGTVGTPWYAKYGNMNIISSNPGNTFDTNQGPLASYGQMGDSGSPLYAYDSIEKKWVLAGVTLHNYGVNGARNNWLLMPKEYIDDIIKKDFSDTVDFKSSSENIVWKYNNTTAEGTLTQGEQSISMNGVLNGNAQNGKNILFAGNGGNIQLADNVNQGAGYLEFIEDYKISTENNSTWTGSGIIVAKDTTVHWGINGVKGDNLHKTGEGTLIIDGQGINSGGLKVGNGTVVLSQKADSEGNSTAFNNIELTGGLATVRLNAENQVNPDNISWGFRGGMLDLNGYDITFNQLQADDYGAIISNKNDKKTSSVMLSLSPLKYDDIGVTTKTINFLGGNGSIGDLFYEAVTKKYYILKSTRYSPFFSDLNNSSVWLAAGSDYNNAVKLFKENKISLSAQPAYIFHGQLEGNMNVIIPVLKGNDILSLDGSVDLPSGTLSKEHGELIFQGHPFVHANQKTSASQKDWEQRSFTVGTLKLDGATFHLSRNADMTGNISANQSQVILGSDKVFTDNNDSTGETLISIKGTSSAPGTSTYSGGITLADNSTLSVQDKFTGGIVSYDSKITVSSDAVLNSATTLVNSALSVENKGKLTIQDSFFSDGSFSISDGSLTMTGKPSENAENIYDSRVILSYGGFSLNSDNSVLQAHDQVSITGDIISDKAAKIELGNASGNTQAQNSFTSGLLSGFNTAYNGAIRAPQASASMQDTLWQITGGSDLKSLNTADSMVLFTRGESGTFHSLEVDTLKASNTAFVMRTDTKNADKLIVTDKLEGKGNLLLVDFIEKKGNHGKLDIDLVTAPSGSYDGVFTTDTQTIGFSNVTPVVERKNEEGHTVWTLTGYNTVANNSAIKKASDFGSSAYKTFLTEVNNLNKRMGDLRDINGEAGAWARIMSGAGSAGGGYSDNYTHVQIGADKKHELDGLDLFTGLTMTYTDSHAGSHDFSGETKSVGAGLYASAMFDSGAYIDLIGKYVHHDNEYTATFAGLGTKDYSSHSWYAGAEVGYRYHVTENAWIEPQAELVYGAVSGKQFSWKDQGMSLSMKDKDFNPLIGRTGIDVGKSFSGKDWKVTARAGIGYQFDLLANGETVLRDASGEKRIKGEKDGRMLMNV